MRVTTRYCTGLAPDTSIASICSVTFILPSSAPMLDAILPAQIMAVITGPISLTNRYRQGGWQHTCSAEGHQCWPQLQYQHQTHNKRGNANQHHAAVAYLITLPHKFRPFKTAGKTSSAQTARKKYALFAYAFQPFAPAAYCYCLLCHIAKYYWGYFPFIIG
jgi:hypothetical protein